MGADLRRRITERLRAVKHLLDCSSEFPGGEDGNRQMVTARGETMDLVTYGQRLNAAYKDGNTEEAIHLLSAKF